MYEKTPAHVIVLKSQLFRTKNTAKFLLFLANKCDVMWQVSKFKLILSNYKL